MSELQSILKFSGLDAFSKASKEKSKKSHSYRKDEVDYVIIIGWADNASSGT